MPDKAYTQSLEDRFFASDTRIAELIWLPTCGVMDHAPSAAFKRFRKDLEAGCIKDNSRLFEAFPKLLHVKLKKAPGPSDYAEVFEGAEGCLLLVDTPIFQYDSAGEPHYSWSHYRSAWLYARDLVAVPTVAITWAMRQHRFDREEAEAFGVVTA